MPRSCVTLIAVLSLLGLLPLSDAKTPADASSKGLLFVAGRSAVPAGGPNEVEGVIQIIDPETNQEVARIPEGPGNIAHMVAVSEDGKLAFAPIYGIAGVGNPGTDGTKIFVYDLTTRKQIDTIDYGHGVRPHEALFNPKDGLLYVTNELDYEISIIDPKTRKDCGFHPNRTAGIA